MSPESERVLILVKHAQPVLDASRPARDWQLGTEGEAQAHRMAAALRRFAPCRVAASPEPKARRTAGILCARLETAMVVNEALRELDRPILPIMPPHEHERFNARAFTAFDEPVLGTESARSALDRFAPAVRDLMMQDDPRNLVVVSHGTVISLFVAAHAGTDAFELWKTLKCGSFVVLGPLLQLREIVETPGEI